MPFVNLFAHQLGWGAFGVLAGRDAGAVPFSLLSALAVHVILQRLRAPGQVVGAETGQGMSTGSESLSHVKFEPPGESLAEPTLGAASATIELIAPIEPEIHAKSNSDGFNGLGQLDTITTSRDASTNQRST